MERSRDNGIIYHGMYVKYAYFLNILNTSINTYAIDTLWEIFHIDISWFCDLSDFAIGDLANN